jgi:cytidylate kinase
VERVVPVIAQIGKVRDWMVARQRDCVQFGPLVMEGVTWQEPRCFRSRR